ncbi:Hypothetical protein PP7435_CHR3-1110 [Komagataella phaffii CBS 7435]|uniref:Uncharacterized protein n=2 Tax=Komagataella phaffii TaxID=460519 RepID=C4R3M0_KOMPG|nr:Hypothetical protein PAS_chr3_0126 [Komagataella phaffii GS115]AOA63396.1 GQ67_03141T0 [Komagataella phaffii]CAH2450197.1 Hypothetical protein BQ9382_C3-5880 [Komagataella phaffii CBS 7435]AOA68577.1 GQ68_03125T0 [Komagataella phaffii GS115]CAY70063.1 Hypothetical protein PAS_chr3_0126 [Komagataella phaffii GS115]CCA40053.1 Hypothetical protein PP7435_CHR3-1110 [Komagataella phaffii CBS 7435]
MVEVFMVHPNLQLSSCNNDLTKDLNRYKSVYETLQERYNEQVRAFEKSHGGSKEDDGSLQYKELGYIKYFVDLAQKEYEYMCSYYQINNIIRKYFSKQEISPEMEEEGLDLIEKEMASYKEIEKELDQLKARRGDVEQPIAEYCKRHPDDEGCKNRKEPLIDTINAHN